MILEPQAEGDLGDRMQRFFVQRFAAGAERVILIGSDSPTLPGEYLQEAFRLLDEHPVVLGPTDDGGYYLVGLRNLVPPIFQRVTWSSANVWDQTVDHLRDCDTPFAVLPAWYDVDDVHDLRRLHSELQESESTDPCWPELSDAVQRALRAAP